MNLHATGDELQQFGFKDKDRVAIIYGKDSMKRHLLKSENLNGNWCTFKYFIKNNIQNAFDWLMKIISNISDSKNRYNK